MTHLVFLCDGNFEQKIIGFGTYEECVALADAIRSGIQLEGDSFVDVFPIGQYPSAAKQASLILDGWREFDIRRSRTGDVLLIRQTGLPVAGTDIVDFYWHYSLGAMLHVYACVPSEAVMHEYAESLVAELDELGVWPTEIDFDLDTRVMLNSPQLFATIRRRLTRLPEFLNQRYGIAIPNVR